MVDIAQTAINLLIFFLIIAIIAQALLSWFVPMGRNPLMVLLNDLTAPVLNPIRRFLPPLGGLDLSPIVAILVLQYLIGPLLIRLTQVLAVG